MFGRGAQSWRIEVDEWESLARPLHKNTMHLAGAHGAEWWGGGRFEFNNSDHAFACASGLRRMGLRARVVLRITGATHD